MVRSNLPQVDQSVQIFLQFSKGALDNERKLDAIFELEDILTEIVETTGIGRFDGNEFCEDTVTFFIYGPDADKIVNELYPVISKIPYQKGSYIFKDYLNSEEQIYLA
jgi:hypothetical protein